MLETVKSYIADMPQMSFRAFFVRHMIAVQDSNIDYEFRQLTSRNILDVKSMEKLIHTTMEGLV